MKHKQIGPGRPCDGDSPRTVIYRVRLSPAEAEAIKAMEITVSELVRAFAIAQINSKRKSREDLPRAS